MTHHILRLVKITVLVLFISSLFISAAQAKPKGVQLGSGYIEYNESTKSYCGWPKTKWLPGKNGKKGFTSYNQWKKFYKKKGNTKKANKFAKKHKKNKTYCGGLQAPTDSADVASLKDLPSTATLVKAASSADVSGTPPTLPAIAQLDDVANLFWQEGIIDALIAGNPTQQQCSEFFGGGEGESGGHGACFMTQGTGYSFEPVVRAGGSLCYMQNGPTQANLDAGAISLVSGSLPNGDADQIFAAPSGAADRLVQVEVTDPQHGSEKIFINVHSQSKNQDNGNQYAFDLWFCRANQSGDNPGGYETTKVTTAGAYESTATGDDDYGKYLSTVTASLAQDADGNVVFDTTKDRTAAVAFEESNNFAFKANITITSSNQIDVKSYDVFGSQGNQPAQTRKAHAVSSIQGASLLDLLFLAGAFKDAVYQDGNLLHTATGATEFRDTFYAAAPSSTLLDQVKDTDFETGTFFTTAPSLSVDTSAYSCSATPDIVVAMDMGNPVLMQSIQKCEEGMLQNMDFCHSNKIMQAEQNWFSGCQQQP
ncbi:hypothetical protein OAO01_07670 [Oligoflexia bacterium]|nr:hypothetical protein [Oligoflexia bacterium]